MQAGELCSVVGVVACPGVYNRPWLEQACLNECNILFSVYTWTNHARDTLDISILSTCPNVPHINSPRSHKNVIWSSFDNVLIDTSSVLQ